MFYSFFKYPYSVTHHGDVNKIKNKQNFERQ